MDLPATLQGRNFGATRLAEVHALLASHPGASRYQLSRLLATQWQWHTPTGQLKDIAARTLLLKLHQRGWIALPPPRMASPTRSGRAPTSSSSLEKTAITTTLTQLGPLEIVEVSSREQRPQRKQLEAALHQFHYLGYRSRVGLNLQYWVSDRGGRPLAALAFGAPAWQCAPRDRWIGWSPMQRAQNLSRIAGNTRFLIFPWVQVPQLASHLLSQISRRLPGDWQRKYGYSVELLESFVDTSRFRGVCYQAANWICLGTTKGRGRQGQDSLLQYTSIKQIYVYPLRADYQTRLASAPAGGHANPSRTQSVDSRR